MSIIPADKPGQDPKEDIMEAYKAEYLRVNGRLPHISRSGSWVIVDYTPLPAGDLPKMLEALRSYRTAADNPPT